MNDFNRRLISSIRVIEESALRINILEKKRKREVAGAAQVIDKVNRKHKQKRKLEVAAAAQVIDKVDREHKQSKNIVASIVGDTNPTA